MQISKYIVKVSVNSKPLSDKEANDLKLSNKDYLQYTLKHELTHGVNMFSAYRHNNIMSLKNTVGYDDNDL